MANADRPAGVTPDQREVIEDAAATLEGEALCLRMSHTLAPEHTDWTGEPEAKAEYDRFMLLAKRLYTIAALPTEMREGGG